MPHTRARSFSPLLPTGFRLNAVSDIRLSRTPRLSPITLMRIGLANRVLQSLLAMVRRFGIAIGALALVAICAGPHVHCATWVTIAIVAAFALEGSAPWPALSPREENVLALSMAGLADKEIAAALGLSIHTVRTYWDRIKDRVGKESRAEVIVEVSRRRADELALDEADKRVAEAYGRRAELEEILGQAPVLVWTSSRSGHIEYANKQFWHYLGSSSIRHIDDAATRALPAGLREPAHDEAVSARLHNGIFEREAPLRRYDGELRWHLLREAPLYDDEGNVKLRVGVAVDIDDLHNRESISALRANRHRLAADICDTGIAYCDPSAGSYYSNKAYESLTGTKATERPWTEAVHPDDRPLVTERWARAERSSKPLVSEHRYLHPDGSVSKAKVKGLAFPSGGWILLADDAESAAGEIRGADNLTRLALVLSDILGLDRDRAVGPR